MRLLLALPILASLVTSAYVQDDETLDPCRFQEPGQTITHPYSCTKYYICERDEEGGLKSVLHECPENFQFHIIDRRCELAYIVNCDEPPMEE